MKKTDSTSAKTVFKIEVPDPDNEFKSINVSVITERGVEYVLVEDKDDESWVFPITSKSHWKQISAAINTALKLCKD
jgi:hypothetical protein